MFLSFSCFGLSNIYSLNSWLIGDCAIAIAIEHLHIDVDFFESTVIVELDFLFFVRILALNGMEGQLRASIVLSQFDVK